MDELYESSPYYASEDYDAFLESIMDQLDSIDEANMILHEEADYAEPLIDYEEDKWSDDSDLADLPWEPEEVYLDEWGRIRRYDLSFIRMADELLENYQNETLLSINDILQERETIRELRIQYAENASKTKQRAPSESAAVKNESEATDDAKPIPATDNVS